MMMITTAILFVVIIENNLDFWDRNTNHTLTYNIKVRKLFINRLFQIRLSPETTHVECVVYGTEVNFKSCSRVRGVRLKVGWGWFWCGSRKYERRGERFRRKQHLVFSTREEKFRTSIYI